MKVTYCDICGEKSDDMGEFKAEWATKSNQSSGTYDGCWRCIREIVAHLKGERKPPKQG